MTDDDLPHRYDQSDSDQAREIDKSSIKHRPSNSMSLTADTTAKLTFSRRKLLGLGLGIAGVGGWVFKDRFLQADQPSQSGSPLAREQEMRDQYQTQNFPITPSFEYETFEIDASGADGSIRQVTASPAQSGDGDRALFVTDTPTGADISDVLIAVWAASEADGAPYGTTVDGTAIDFTIYSGAETVIATAVRTSATNGNTDEVYIVRGRTQSTVESLIDGYSDFYISQA